MVNPKLLLQDSRFDDLWNYNNFASRLVRVIFDEGHCVSQWGGSFRPEYGNLYRLWFQLPKSIQFYVASATLPKVILDDVSKKLRLRRDSHVIQRSNDCWNCQLIVWQMQHPIKSFRDLDFLVPKGWKLGQALPYKFFAFFNSRKDAEAATEYLWHRSGLMLKNHIVWFHSVMTEVYRADTLESLKADQGLGGGTWGLACTDAAGMVGHLST